MIYDIILITLVVLSVFIGIRKGAAKTLLSLAAILLSVAFALFIARPLSEYIYSSFVRDSVESDVNTAIVEQADKAEFENPISEKYVSAMDYFGESDKKMQSACTQLIADKGSDAAGHIVDMYKPAITGFISTVIALILFFIFGFIFNLAAKAISKVFRLPFINFVDKAAGAVVGFLRGILIIAVLAMALKILAPVIPADSFFGSSNISSSSVFAYVYNGGLSAAIQSFIYNLS